jgi:hypothetical protein
MSEQRLRRSAQSSRTGTAGAASSETAALIRINDFGYGLGVERRRDPVRDARSAAGIRPATNGIVPISLRYKRASSATV